MAPTRTAVKFMVSFFFGYVAEKPNRPWAKSKLPKPQTNTRPSPAHRLQGEVGLEWIVADKKRQHRPWQTTVLTSIKLGRASDKSKNCWMFFSWNRQFLSVFQKLGLEKSCLHCELPGLELVYLEMFLYFNHLLEVRTKKTKRSFLYYWMY